MAQGNWSLRSIGLTISNIAIVLAIAFGGLLHWTINRVYVPEGKSLQLRYKGPLLFGSRATARPGHFAKVDEDGDPLEIGVFEQLRGPGRHFYCPIWWERELIDDLLVETGEVAIVTSKLGDNLPTGQFMVDGDLDEVKHKGVLRKVFGPGRYRVNTYAFEFKKLETKAAPTGDEPVGPKANVTGWVGIPTGYVGVVTNLTDNPATKAKAGIQDKVLQPGIYLVNPQEQKVDIVGIGLGERSISVVHKLNELGEPALDENGEPLIAEAAGGISFPSSDGFLIHMDFTVVWGVMPDQAPQALAKFGDINAVEQKVILPQIESICRNLGSKYKAAELLVGESREEFQTEVSTAFRKALHGTDVTLQQGLVRYVYIPQAVRSAIQEGAVADELTLTRGQEELTAKTEGDLREAERKVELEAERTIVETEKKVALIKAEGDKLAEETKAESVKLVAAIDKDTAELEREAAITLGEAEGKSQQLMEEAKAGKFALAVAAFGSGDAYNQWVFANGLPEDIELDLLYAGEGTFWTDLKGFTDTMLGRQAERELRGKQQPRGAAATPAASR